MLAPQITAGIFGLLDRILPDQEQRDRAKLELIKAEGQQELATLSAAMSAILAEANSADKWTSRARPGFLYLMYSLVLFCVFGAVLSIWYPTEAKTAAENFGLFLHAIPESLWALFGAGYLGYGTFRSFDKWKAPK